MSDTPTYEVPQRGPGRRRRRAAELEPDRRRVDALSSVSASSSALLVAAVPVEPVGVRLRRRPARSRSSCTSSATSSPPSWTGMKATQFFLFMGPKLWSFRRGETEYGVRAYPVGAFVRIIGMNNLDEVDAEDEPRAYRNKSYPRRMLVITAGSIMHMLIAIVLLFGSTRQRQGESRPAGSASAPSSPDSPPRSAGVEAGDIVVSIDGVEPTTPDEFVDQIQSSSAGRRRRRWSSIATATILTDEVGARHQPERRARRSARRFSASARAARCAWNNESVAAAAGAQRHRPRPDGVAERRRRRQGAQPGQHLRAPRPAPTTTRPRSRPRSSASAGSAPTIGDETGFGGILLMLAGVNVFVGLLNMFPRAAVRRRPRGDRHVRAICGRAAVARRTAPTSPR